MEANQLIAEVARTTGVRLDKSDPILAAAVIHEALLNEALMKLDRQVTIQADRVTAASTQAVVDAKREAEALITDAGDWFDGKVRMAGEATAALILAEVSREIRNVQQARRAVVRIAWIGAIFGLAAASALSGYAIAAFR